MLDFTYVSHGILINCGYLYVVFYKRQNEHGLVSAVRIVHRS